VKLRTALTLTALASLMALPFAAIAQGYGHFGDQSNRGGQGQRGGDLNRGGGSQHGSQNDTGSKPSRGNDKGSGSKGGSWTGGDQSKTDRNPGRGSNNKGSDWNRGSTGDSFKNDHRPIQPPTRTGNDWNRGSGNRGGNWNRGSSNDRNDWNRGSNWGNDHRYGHSWSDRDDWRGITSSFSFSINLNLLDRDDTICFDGEYGDYYPVWEYDRDCDSRDSLLRARAGFFARTFFYRNDHRYERRLVSHMASAATSSFAATNHK